MSKLPKEIAQRLRSLCGVKRSHCPVEAVPGCLSPTLSGRAGYTLWKRSNQPRWQRSTLLIKVGDEWLAGELDYKDILAARLGLRPDTPIGIICDFAEENNLPVNVSMLRIRSRTLGEKLC